MVAGETYSVSASIYNFGLEKLNVTLKRYEALLTNKNYQTGYEVLYVDLDSLDASGYEMEFV